MEKGEKLYEEIIAEHPKHVHAHLLFIQNIENTESIKAIYPLTFAKSLKDVQQSGEGEESKKSLDEELEKSDEKDDVVVTSIDDEKSPAVEDRKEKDKKKAAASKLSNLPNLLTKIIHLADRVIKDTDKDALLAFYGMKCDTRPDAAKIKT